MSAKGALYDDLGMGGASYTANVMTAFQDGPSGMKTLSDLKKMFDDYRTTTNINGTQRLIDYDYYDGNQLTPQEVEILRSRGQPDIIVNRTRVAVNGILGVISQSATDPKCWGRNMEDEESASVATDCLRYATEKGRFNRLKVDIAKDYLIGGTGAILIAVDDKFNVTFDQVRWEECFIDPRSRKPDGSDARYKGIAKWMFIEDLSIRYPKYKDDLENITEGGTASLGTIDERFEDRPVAQGWIDLRNKRALCVELYYREGPKWWKAVFFYGGVLEQGLSPYKDDMGDEICPIEMQSCYVDRDNNRYGVVKDMRDLQDEINKRRSKLLHLVNSSQIEAADPSAIEVDADTARLEAARPDGVIPYGWKKVPTNDMAQGQQILLTEAKSELERLGPNPAILGRQGADSSGKAILSRQQAGLTELAVVLDQFTEFELRCYKATWCRIKQFWTEPQIIRVTDDDDSPKFIMINQPIVDPNVAGKLQQGSGQALVDPATGSPVVAEGTLGYKNHIAEMDVDVIIDTAPATPTILQEQFKDLMDLVGTNPLYSQQVPFSVFLELMPGVPHKRRLQKMIANFSQQQQQMQQQQQQQQQERQDALLTAKVNDMSSKAGLNTALAAKAASDAKTTQQRAGTQAASALFDATIAHEEQNIKRYQAATDAAAQKAEADEPAATNE